MSVTSWDFDYRPVTNGRQDDGKPRRDLVVATEHDVDPARVVELLAPLAASFEAVPVVSSHPLYWTRLQSSAPMDRNEIIARLEQGGIRVRYVACAHHGSQALAPPLELTNATPRRARGWKTRPSRQHHEARDGGRWFVGPPGVDAEHHLCGTGAGTRLAVIDDDAAQATDLGLDAEIKTFTGAPARASQHAALLVGWAVGTPHFAGVAPDASPRLYVIPKPGQDVVSLPAAILRAVDDGADVIVCATYVDDVSGPLLDDALELAARLGRGGRGTAVLFPTSREVSSPPGSTHASLSLSLGAPASHPRAFCIAPSGSAGGWFVWRDQSGRLRPFANRGPAVRWLAPGDDMADPLAPAGVERLTHAESSGACAVAAGVVLLTLAQNPELYLSEVDELLTRTACPPSEPEGHAVFADAWDMMPNGRDCDGHDAKHGYGRLSARRACLYAADPLAAMLVQMGETGAAAMFLELRHQDAGFARAYSPKLALWAVRALLADASLRHGLCSLLRHARLVSGGPGRVAAHPPGALIRQVALLIRMAGASRMGPPQEEALTGELRRLQRAISELSADSDAGRAWETALYAKLALWPAREPRLPAQQPLERVLQT